MRRQNRQDRRQRDYLRHVDQIKTLIAEYDRMLKNIRPEDPRQKRYKDLKAKAEKRLKKLELELKEYAEAAGITPPDDVK